MTEHSENAEPVGEMKTLMEEIEGVRVRSGETESEDVVMQIEIRKYTFDELFPGDVDDKEVTFEYNDEIKRYVLTWVRDHEGGGVSKAASNGCKPGGV